MKKGLSRRGIQSGGLWYLKIHGISTMEVSNTNQLL
jgi:hypothetical protein